MAITGEQLLERIILNPKVMLGKPVVRGTRLTVEFILNRRANNASVAEILEEYGGLTGRHSSLPLVCYEVFRR